MKKIEKYVPDIGNVKKLLKIMKITFLLICVFTFQSVASIYAQSTKINMSMKNATFKDVIEFIEEETEFYFMLKYDMDILDRKVDVEFKNANITEVLDELLKNSGYSYKLIDRYIAINRTVDFGTAQQQATISGTVTDEGGQPLPGVTVVIKGTTQGTVTNVDGNYSISNIPPDATLVFSFVGMRTQEITVGNLSVIDISLVSDIIGVDEIIVIGYGTQKKSNLTAAVEMVNVDVLENRPVKSVGEMLAGAVPNLNITKNSGAPDAVESFNIRGFTGFGLSGAPLILVDGVEQNINNVNANDIESISVLKDAAASAIYGSRAPNGVLLIITKSGKKGEGMRINYSANFNINQPTYMPSNVNGLEFVKLRNMLGNNSGQAQWYTDENMEKIQAYLDGDGPSNTMGADGVWGAYRSATGSTDFYEAAFKDLSQDMTHNLDVSGGTDKSTFYMGLGYQTKEGIYQTDLDNYDRMSAILKMNTDIAEWVKVGMNVRYSRTNTLRPNFRNADSGSSSDKTLFNGLGYFPNHPLYNPDGSIHIMNPLIALYGLTGDIHSKNNDLWLIPSIELRPLKGLLLRSSFSWNNNTYETTSSSFTAFTDTGRGFPTRFNWASTNEGLEQNVARKDYYQVEANAEYTKSIGKHNLLFLTGFQQEYSHYDNLSAGRTQFYSSTIPSFSAMYGDVMNINERIYEWGTRGYYFRGSYNFDGKYLMDFNGRYDASSRYSKDNRWAFFPSISVGYNVAKEKFWPLEKVNTFKLTGSWGRSGNQNTGNGNADLYTYLPTLWTGSLTNIVLGSKFQPYVTLPPILSSDLTWAKPESIGFGVEVGAFTQ